MGNLELIPLGCEITGNIGNGVFSANGVDSFEILHLLQQRLIKFILELTHGGESTDIKDTLAERPSYTSRSHLRIKLLVKGMVSPHSFRNVRCSWYLATSDLKLLDPAMLIEKWGCGRLETRHKQVQFSSSMSIVQEMR